VSFGFPGVQSATHQVYHSDADHCFAVVCNHLIVLCQSPVSPEPSKGSFDDPSFGQDGKSFNVVAALDDFQRTTQSLFCPFNQLAGIAAVRPNEREAAKALAQVFKDQLGSVAILNGGLVDDHGDNEPEGVNDNVPLSSVNFLSGIVSAKPPFSVVLTDWLSMMAALGVGSRPQALRTCSRRRSWILVQTPVFTNNRK